MASGATSMLGFDLSRTFISHDAMVNHVKFWADQVGFRIVVHPKLSFNELQDVMCIFGGVGK